MRAATGAPDRRRAAAASTSARTRVGTRQLITAALVWVYAVRLAADGYTPATATIMVSMSVGALFANVVSVFLLVVETVSFAPR